MESLKIKARKIKNNGNNNYEIGNERHNADSKKMEEYIVENSYSDE